MHVIVIADVLVSLMLNLLMVIVKEFSGYHIISGDYGTGIKLDGLNMALIASWPVLFTKGMEKHHSI
ncbi:hypothetical protein BH18THE2_BH18THE2_38170 [soil metagenome]